MTTLTLEQASHLARRAGFAATSEQVEMLTQAYDQNAAVDLLFEQPSSVLDLPSWYGQAPNPRPENEEERLALRRQQRDQGLELKYWWFQQMVANTSSLQEKMTLFWANHFTSSLKKVKIPQLMLNQNLLLRQHAVGSFRELLAGIIKDPAMLIYLDNASSQKASPNENFARELMELFTMGEGNYSETDVKELSRALTGASVSLRTGKYIFKRRWHDSTEKTIFGEIAAFGPDEVADLILRQPSVGPFIAGKLWRFFIDDFPTDTDLEVLGQRFVDSDFSISSLLKALFERPQFWESVGQKIKSPMELLVGSIQLFDLNLPNQQQTLSVAASMGQNLFDPPHVKGWAEGRAWYNSSTLYVREQVIKYVVQGVSDNLPIEQVLAVNSIGKLPQESSAMYMPLALHDPAYQVV